MTNKIWKNIGITVLVTLIWLILLELFLTGVFIIKDFFVPRPESFVGILDERTKADAYKGGDWTPAYYKEFNETSRYRWKSYVNIRRMAYQGQYINMDQDGYRFDPALDVAVEGGLSVFVFGGSTVWGSGVRDHFTVPSLLKQGFAREGIHVKVKNFGETGYVSTQGVIELMLQLQQGHIPDLVVFYDGVNDVYAAYQGGQAGIPQNETNRVAEFNLTDPVRYKDAVWFAVKSTLKRTAFKRLVNWIKERVRAPAAAGTLPADPQELVEDIVKIYMANMDIVKGLAAQYGFRYAFYWQPTIFDKPFLTAFEKRQQDKEIAVKPLYEHANARLHFMRDKIKANHVFADLTGIFALEKAPVYVDWCHLGEDGNAAIAQEMLKTLVPLVKAAQ